MERSTETDYEPRFFAVVLGFAITLGYGWSPPKRDNIVTVAQSSKYWSSSNAISVVEVCAGATADFAAAVAFMVDRKTNTNATKAHSY